MGDSSDGTVVGSDGQGSLAARRRFVFPWLIFVVALILVTGLILPVARFLIERPLYYSRSREIQGLLRSLHSRCPRGIPAQNWEEGVNWTITAECNIFFSPAHASRAALDRFKRDLEDRLRGPVGPDTIEWIWDQFAESGEAGRSYVEKFRPSMREALRPVTPPPATPAPTKTGR